MKIIVDMMGGDNAPLAVLEGTAQAVKEYGVQVIGVGSEELVRKTAAEHNIPLDGIELVNCTETIEMCDEPARAIRSKKDSSIVVGLNLLKEGKGDAFVSAGSTGALHVGASLIVRTLKGVKRPALATMVPAKNKAYLLLDCGANVECRPEMLAAFITPNHAVLTPIIKRAAAILEQWTGTPSLDEYQSRNPDRVRKQMAAIYTALTEQQIIYSTIPASFEEHGQRVRLTDSVLAQKLGTCLDMALLYTSCLESIGLNALIVITKGHAFAGGWLVPETFPDPAIDDVSLLTKRTAEGIYDITLVETICMNMGHNADFDNAVKSASDPGSFILAIDIRRARHSGVRPIPQRVLNGQVWEIKEDEDMNRNTTHATPQSVNPYDLSGSETQTVLTKQLLWERRLLDSAQQLAEYPDYKEYSSADSGKPCLSGRCLGGRR